MKYHMVKDRIAYSAKINTEHGGIKYWVQFHPDSQTADLELHKAVKREYPDNSYLVEVVPIPAVVWKQYEGERMRDAAEMHGAARVLHAMNTGAHVRDKRTSQELYGESYARMAPALKTTDSAEDEAWKDL